MGFEELSVTNENLYEMREGSGIPVLYYNKPITDLEAAASAVFWRNLLHRTQRLGPEHIAEADSAANEALSRLSPPEQMEALKLSKELFS